MFKKGAVALGLSIVLAGCATDPDRICFPDQAVAIPEASVPAKTSEELKVIVLPVDFEFKDSAQKKIQSAIRNSLEGQVVSTGTRLVDRKLANKLKGEIKLAEQSGRYNSKGVPIADLAVLTEVTSSNLSYSFSEADSYTDDDGKTHRIPAKCRFKVEVDAIAKVVSLPDMSLVKRIKLHGYDTRSTETNRSNCPISNAGYAGLASKAATEAVDYNLELKSLLAPTAQVLELRQCEEGAMVKIGVGSNKNIQPNAEVAFSKIIKNSSGELETFSIGEGEVVDIENDGIKPNYSWVGIDEKVALKIQKGDAAKVTPEGCALLDLKCKLMNL